MSRTFNAAAAWGLALLLAACAETPRRTQPLVAATPVEVRVPVPVPCVRSQDVPPAPALPSDAELAQLTDYELVIQLDIHRRALRAWNLHAAALLARCGQTVSNELTTTKELR